MRDTMRTKRRLDEWVATAPSFLWLALFFLAPSLIVLVVALKPADPFGGVSSGWTFDNVLDLATPTLLPILWRTLWISAVATAGCIAIGLPASYCLARLDKPWRTTLLLLVIIPFWTSFLIRVFAWKTLLHPDGAFKAVLVASHLVSQDAVLLYNDGAVLLVMIYTCLPFAILPLYASIEKFDFHLLEAAQDLGATRWKAVQTVFIPGIRRGLITAVIMVFVPALGSYVVPDLVGGISGEMLGNKITQRAFSDRHLPAASALALLLMAAVLLPLLAQAIWSRRSHVRLRKGIEES